MMNEHDAGPPNKRPKIGANKPSQMNGMFNTQISESSDVNLIESLLPDELVLGGDDPTTNTQNQPIDTSLQIKQQSNQMYLKIPNQSNYIQNQQPVYSVNSPQAQNILINQQQTQIPPNSRIINQQTPNQMQPTPLTTFHNVSNVNINNINIMVQPNQQNQQQPQQQPQPNNQVRFNSNSNLLQTPNQSPMNQNTIIRPPNQQTQINPQQNRVVINQPNINSNYQQQQPPVQQQQQRPPSQSQPIDQDPNRYQTINQNRFIQQQQQQPTQQIRPNLINSNPIQTNPQVINQPNNQYQQPNYYNYNNNNQIQQQQPTIQQQQPPIQQPIQPPVQQQQQQQQQPIVQPPLQQQQQQTQQQQQQPQLNSVNEQEKRKLIQQQLILLLHAHKCSQHPERQCNVSHCSTMKEVLTHLTQCNEGRNCTRPHCASSRQIIGHWKNCNKPDCPVCYPLRQNQNNNNNNNTNTNNNNTSNNNQQNQQRVQPVNLLQQEPQQPTVHRPWHEKITTDMRRHLIQKIIQTIFPTQDPRIYTDPRLTNLVNYAVRTEYEMYDQARDQEEYFHLLAEKIYKIQKEFEDKRNNAAQNKNNNNNNNTNNSIINNSNLDKNDFQNQLNPLNAYNPDLSAGNGGPPNRLAPSVDLKNLKSREQKIKLETDLIKPEMDTYIKEEIVVTSEDNTSNNVDNTTATNTITVKTEPMEETVKTEPLYISPNKIKTEMIKTEDESSPSKLNTSGTSSSAVASSSSNDNDKIEKSVATTTKGPNNKPIIKFPSEYLMEKLMPIFDAVASDPDAWAFLEPVDPERLGLHDYFTIIKKPMDLSTIRKKFEEGKYLNPQEYVDDMWLMFNNAWLYNKKTSKVYKNCTKLSEIFSSKIDQVMKEMGYCCGQQFTFSPQVLFCYGNQMCCTIARDGVYFLYNNADQSRPNVNCDKYTYCIKCFEAIKSDTVPIGDDPSQPLVDVKKSLFVQMKNDHEEPEQFVDCAECGRKWHQICALYMEQIFTKFTCETCLREKKELQSKKDNRYTSAKLQRTQLGDFLENRVNSYLKLATDNDAILRSQTGRVTIRILSCVDKICEVKPMMKNRFEGEINEQFPFKTKAIFAFEEIDGTDVCFFGMHVQEYGSEVPHPNTRRVYISYLDSVFFFRPKELRTNVYHEILIGYLDYAKRMGFQWAHIWACPPSEGDDYIFHCHPVEQKVPKPKRLQDWYKKMLDKGIIERVVIDYKDIYKDAIENGVKTPTDIPYFEGDFWPNVLEDCIRESEQEEEKRRKEEAEMAMAAANEDFSTCNDDTFGDSMDCKDQNSNGKKKSLNQQKKKNIKSKMSQRKSVKKVGSSSMDLLSKILSTMEKHKEVFFVIRLLDAKQVIQMGPIVDKDQPISCELMNGRDEFLNFARDKHHEFSSLRRAKYSSLALLYELHNQNNEKFIYTCNKCKCQMEVRYHCTVCEDFDLCFTCYETKGGHEHKMEKLLAGQTSSNEQDAALAKKTDQKSETKSVTPKPLIEVYVTTLIHAVHCRNANCTMAKCMQFKRVVQHSKQCQKYKTNQCDYCRQLIALCIYHAKLCKDDHCQVPFCSSIKLKLKQQRAFNSQAERRRMLMMNKTFRQSGNHGSTANLNTNTNNNNNNNNNPSSPQEDNQENQSQQNDSQNNSKMTGMIHHQNGKMQQIIQHQQINQQNPQIQNYSQMAQQQQQQQQPIHHVQSQPQFHTQPMGQQQNIHMSQSTINLQQPNQAQMNYSYVNQPGVLNSPGKAANLQQQQRQQVVIQNQPVMSPSPNIYPNRHPTPSSTPNTNAYPSDVNDQANWQNPNYQRNMMPVQANPQINQSYPINHQSQPTQQPQPQVQQPQPQQYSIRPTSSLDIQLIQRYKQATTPMERSQIMMEIQQSSPGLYNQIKQQQQQQYLQQQQQQQQQQLQQTQMGQQQNIPQQQWNQNNYNPQIQNRYPVAQPGGQIPNQIPGQIQQVQQQQQPRQVMMPNQPNGQQIMYQQQTMQMNPNNNQPILQQRLIGQQQMNPQQQQQRIMQQQQGQMMRPNMYQQTGQGMQQQPMMGQAHQGYHQVGDQTGLMNQTRDQMLLQAPTNQMLMSNQHNQNQTAADKLTQVADNL
ncbi:unnamed protein product [Brachionus calyciflorus]|uniref:histone acetyltransferase n=1 Tax=Brachionus calyciflorus TaxID=104777 RepID=A0A813M1V5_9BILA|nr:unnamed protein product [Brachionus calyciflorus]